MNIALDFDNTYTADPELWIRFVDFARKRGHHVYIVTMRYDHGWERDEVHKELVDHVDGMIFTSRAAKRKHCVDNHGMHFDVWIDDNPEMIGEHSHALLFTEDTPPEFLKNGN